MLVYAFYVGAVGFMIVPFVHSIALLMLAAFVFGLGMGCGTPITVMLMFARSKQGRSGCTLGIRLTTTNAVRVLGPVVFGAIGTAFGVPPVFWINAVLMGATGLLAARASRARRQGDETKRAPQRPFVRVR